MSTLCSISPFSSCTRHSSVMEYHLHPLQHFTSLVIWFGMLRQQDLKRQKMAAEFLLHHSQENKYSFPLPSLCFLECREQFS